MFAHRLFDLVPGDDAGRLGAPDGRGAALGGTALLIVVAVGLALFTVAWLERAQQNRSMKHDLQAMGTIRRLLVMARQGLSVLKAPLPLAGAILLQCLGWLLQLMAVWVTMQAFGIDAPLPAAGLVLVLMNVATIVPLWPGNVGLVQAAVALPLRNYGVAYSTGFAFGLALQAIEIACGVALGLLSLAREGISVAMLRRMQDEEDSSENAIAEAEELVEDLEREATREGAPVSR